MAWPDKVAILYILGPGSYPLIADIVVFLAYVGCHVTQGDSVTITDMFGIRKRIIYLHYQNYASIARCRYSQRSLVFGTWYLRAYPSASERKYYV